MVALCLAAGCSDPQAQKAEQCAELKDEFNRARSAFESQREKAKQICGYSMFLNITEEKLDEWSRGEGITTPACGAKTALVTEAYRGQAKANEILHGTCDAETLAALGVD